MQVRNFTPVHHNLANSGQQKPVEEQQQNPANPADPKPTEGSGEEDAMARQIVDSLVSSPEFTKKALTKLGKGEELTIVVNDAEVIKVKNDGPSLTSKFLTSANQIATAAANEAARLVEADPAFAFKEAALGVRTQVTNGLPREAANTLENYFLPVVRLAALGLDTNKAVATFRNKDSTWFDRTVDGVHVGTDLIGLIGAVGYIPKVGEAVPFLANAAPTMTAIGLAGDVLAYSIHVLQYLRERGQVNLNDNQGPPSQEMHISPKAGPGGDDTKAA